MSSLKQENLTPLFASCETESKVIIIMESAWYGTVDSSLGKNDDWLEEAKVAKRITCTAIGLRYMHEADMIHCDIKPDIILFTQWKRVLQVKIYDFGEAQRNGEDENEDHIGGTEGYCSPAVMGGT